MNALTGGLVSLLLAGSLGFLLAWWALRRPRPALLPAALSASGVLPLALLAGPWLHTQRLLALGLVALFLTLRLLPAPWLLPAACLVVPLLSTTLLVQLARL